ncbi:hypothetical protein PHYSODRAFT_294445 [Phytophthora sojae]|uniref:Uncharacterized protein n=1 Tax=Phytophthora sojae (strain P6497) TaxID=1094619 RepID=G4YJ27_PHYSP|nr:hypothetical protein PHYSODRAFT_294445 [Phytophthora sojae]EGZ29167.1 hypothetical protein PHYSODRAFT_294445 [Phytophthora sojae]|eukprot:XP_009516442.1 hypothetical protein PHYSODRAFT_294445 [Phytophthora sojae]
MHEAYITKFAKHQNKQIERARQLPLETKLAFLSVLDCCKSLRPTKERKRGDAPASTSAMCKLDLLMLSNILAFTAPPVFRRVICRSVSEFGVGDAAGAGGDHDSDEEENNLEEEQSDEGEQSGESEEETQDDKSDEEEQDHESDAGYLNF